MSHTPASWKYFLAFLTLIAATIWLAVAVYPDPRLRLIACDVGQGDAILAVYGKTQILIDGGPGSKVLDCLADYLPFWDKEIELVILTHPQTDHFAGLNEVFRGYKVNAYLTTPIDASTQGYQVLKSTVGGSGAKVINPTTGMVIRFGLLHLDILWPSESFLTEKIENYSSTSVLGAFSATGDPNDYSVVLNLRLGDFDALLTADIGPAVIDNILETGKVHNVEYIKIPHHGSKNGLTTELVYATTPEIAVISVGKNPWGHPHREVLDMLESYGLRVLRTDEVGDVEVVTDGERWWVKD